MNHKTDMEAALAGQSAGVAEGITEKQIADAIKQWFPDRAYQAPFFARSLFAAAPAPVSAPAPDREQATLCEDGGKCGIGGYCGQCEKVRAASDPEPPNAHGERPIEPEDIDAVAEAIQRETSVEWLIASRAAVAAIDTLIARGNHASERVEQECPHGVDDGACKQCYGEAVSGGRQGCRMPTGDELRTAARSVGSLGTNHGDASHEYVVAGWKACMDACKAASAPTLGEGQGACACVGLGHTRNCPLFDESMMSYEPFGGSPTGTIHRPDLESDPLWQWLCIAKEAEIVVTPKGKFLMLNEEMCVRLGSALEDAASAPTLVGGDGEVAVRAKTVHRRIDALCEAANTSGADYFDASTSMLIATRDLLTALGFPHRMAAPQPRAAEPKEYGGSCEDCKWSAISGGGLCDGCAQAAEPKGLTEKQRDAIEHAIPVLMDAKQFGDVVTLRALLANGE